MLLNGSWKPWDVSVAAKVVHNQVKCKTYYEFVEDFSSRNVMEDSEYYFKDIWNFSSDTEDLGFIVVMILLRRGLKLRKLPTVSLENVMRIMGLQHILRFLIACPFLMTLSVQSFLKKFMLYLSVF